NHPDALVHPWRWALIHGAFVLAACAANIIIWREGERASARTALILASVGDGILGLDTHGNITFANPAAAALLGWAPAELIGRDGHRVLHVLVADGPPCLPGHCPVAAACATGARHEREAAMFRRRDGSCFPVEFSSTPVRERGTTVGAVMSFVD